MSSPAEEFQIFLPVFTTDEHAFDRFQVNAIPFKTKKPEEALKLTFKELISVLSERGIFAYPHHDKLYFILRNRYDDVSALLADIDEAVSRLAPYVDCDPNGISLIDLHPVTDNSHFVITRALVYSLIIAQVSSTSSNKLRMVEESKKPKKQSLLLPIDTRPIGDVKFEGTDATIEVHYYLKPLFEVTPKGRGRIWFDIKVRVSARLPNGKRIFLEQREVKRLSEELYRECRKLSMPQPVDRLKTKIEAMKKVLEGAPRGLCYYVYDVSKRSFEERCYVFKLIRSDFPQSLLHD